MGEKRRDYLLHLQAVTGGGSTCHMCLPFYSNEAYAQVQ